LCDAIITSAAEGRRVSVADLAVEGADRGAR
jgi:hypothetical protein